MLDKKNNNKNGRGVGEGEEVSPSITESDLETGGVGWAGGGGVQLAQVTRKNYLSRVFMTYCPGG